MDYKAMLKGSFLLSGNNSIHRLYEESRCKQIWDDFCSAEDPAKTSIYAKPFIWLEKVLDRSLPLPLDSLMCWLFALYLPIEYVIRDVLSIGILASVWEELFICAGIFVIYLKGRFNRVSSVEVFMLLYMLVGLILCLINRPYPSVAFAGWRAQFEYMVWFMLIIRLIDSAKTAKILVWIFTGVVFLMTLHGIYQYIIAVPIPASWTSQTEMAVRTRVFSITGSPNIFGDIIVLAAPSLASLIYYLRKPLHKFAAFCGLGVMLLCILFTFSKGSWIGLIVAVLLFAMYLDKRIILAMGTAMAVVLAAVPSVTNRLTYLFTTDYVEASAVGGRAMRWALGKTLLYENSKWIGFGLGRYGGAVAMNNQMLDKTEEFAYYYMDNYYLKTLVEMGYIGLIFFILLLVVLLIYGFKSCHRAGSDFNSDYAIDPLFRNIGNDKVIAVGVFSGICGCLAHCYFENIFEEPYMMAYFWGLAAVLIYLGYYKKKV